MPVRKWQHLAMDLFVWAEDSENALRAEILDAYPGARIEAIHGLLSVEIPQATSEALTPFLVFARQQLPNAQPVNAESVRNWADAIATQAIAALPDDQPWALHVAPHYAPSTTHHIGARAWHTVTRRKTAPGHLEPAAKTPNPEAGQRRCQLIQEAVRDTLRKNRRALLRHLHPAPRPFAETDSLVQALLTSPESGFISVARTPLPFQLRRVVSPFPKGEVPTAVDKNAPSRAFAKLVEAEQRLGLGIQAGQTCVDLGASPGSWSYVAVQRGAKVIAVDRSPLRDDLMRHRAVHFSPGDAFQFSPPRPVDWLLCDVIAAPERSTELLLQWLSRGWCRNFIVTIKLKDDSGEKPINLLKQRLPDLCRHAFLTRLCANKREICAFGVTRLD